MGGSLIRGARPRLKRAMYFENRIVAMFDVLGFAGTIRDRASLERTTLEYSKLIADAKHHMFSPTPTRGSPKPEPNFEHGQFVFDTLVLVSFPIDMNAACRFVFATEHLMGLFFGRRYPLRGSIGIGDYCFDDRSGIFLSNVFKQLDVDGSNQQWSGCAILPDAEMIVGLVLGKPDPGKLCQSSPLHKTSIPVKSGPVEHRWCVNWSYFLSPSELGAGLAHMSGDGQKLDNTRAYLDFLRGLRDDRQQLSKEFAPAKTFKVMNSTCISNLKFEDENGNGVEPGCNFRLDFKTTGSGGE